MCLGRTECSGRPLCGFEAALSALKNSIDLRAPHSWKPFQKLLHRSAAFGVFEEHFHGDARVFLKSQAPLTFPGIRSTAGTVSSR